MKEFTVARLSTQKEHAGFCLLLHEENYSPPSESWETPRKSLRHWGLLNINVILSSYLEI